MIIVLKKGSPDEKVQELIKQLETGGVGIHVSKGVDHTILGLVGDTSRMNETTLQAHHLVEQVIRVQAPYKMANRAFHPDNTVITVDSGIKGALPGIFGGKDLAIIAGPCSVESREQIISIAEDVKKSGARFLRGGAFKPRTSPYSFQGMGGEGIDLLLEAKKATGLPIVTELMAVNQLELFSEVDVIQIGARNMQNFNLLKEVGHCNKTILLKRGLANTAKELLMSAEYIMAGGNENVVLCERGIRSFDNFTRNVLDLGIIPFLKKESHLPIIVDPSHATGLHWMVSSMSKAAVAAGADGIMVEVHNNPECALCDGEQAITPVEFDALMAQLRQQAQIEGRTL